MQLLESSRRNNSGIGIICKFALKTVGRYGKITLLMLFLGFFFLITTAHSYSQLSEELSQPYILSGTVTGQADLARYGEVEAVEAVTPVLSFDTELSTKDASLSASVAAVTAEYLNLDFIQGNLFSNETNMPFLVLNRYAAEHFLSEEETEANVSVGDNLTMTISDGERSASVCGIFEDGLEEPVVYMSYSLAARILPKSESVDLRIRLSHAQDLDEGARELKKLDVSLSYEEDLPQSWRLNKQQIYQTALSALVLILCAAVQMGSRHRREMTEAIAERQALLSSGLGEGQLRCIFPLRTVVTGLGILSVAYALAAVLSRLSLTAVIVGGTGFLLHSGIVIVLQR